MTRRDFIIMVTVTIFETILLNDALLSSDFIVAGFWGWLLYRNLKKTYLITKFNKTALASTKKKD